MRTPSSVFAVGRYALALVVVAASVLMVSGQNKTTFDAHDKAAYATQAMIQYVNPGLVFSVVSAKIATDGTITVDYKATDPKGLAWIRRGFRPLEPSQTAFWPRIFPKGRPSMCLTLPASRRRQPGAPRLRRPVRTRAERRKPLPSASISIRLRPRRRLVSTRPPRIASAFTVRGT